MWADNVVENHTAEPNTHHPEEDEEASWVDKFFDFTFVPSLMVTGTLLVCAIGLSLIYLIISLSNAIVALIETP